MNYLFERCIDSIDNSTLDQLKFEDDIFRIYIKIDETQYVFIVKGYIFGLFSKIYFLENNLNLIKELRISRSEFNLIKSKFHERINSINEQKFNNIFKEISRKNKLEKILN